MTDDEQLLRDFLGGRFTKTGYLIFQAIGFALATIVCVAGGAYLLGLASDPGLSERSQNGVRFLGLACFAFAAGMVGMCVEYAIYVQTRLRLKRVAAFLRTAQGAETLRGVTAEHERGRRW